MNPLDARIDEYDRDNYLLRRIVERFTGDLLDVVDFLEDVMGVERYQCAEHPLEVFYSVFERFPFDLVDKETFYTRLLRFVVECDA